MRPAVLKSKLAQKTQTAIRAERVGRLAGFGMQRESAVAHE